ncbi:MAG: SAM-dependent methyltransferase [Gallionellales bacterium 35-53-114]|jgi:SAM-dependent methyltransferase|nr:MAG: SAM-dependent methyltransferase [Gallionellales bacterium 35-53-114]OYZ63055.1 MAG: SAM-dependent methyltransferase [Gallionellales bacterium 24-53-125]OZB08964.1 MAG: SAM-dependent methyltransferase [Gallionellales bacterium 39-52-133]
MSTASSLSVWFATPQGQYVLTREQEIFDSSVADIFGFNAVQLGLPQQNLLRGSRIPLHIRAGKEAGVHLWLEAEELPFETGSIDLVLLPHILEFSMHPHQILREVERVLRPEGSVVISGFNPLSLWGMRRAIGQKKEYPWCGKFISLLRLKDWLALLGFETEAGRFCCYAPPFAGSALVSRSRVIDTADGQWWSVVGGVYLLQAKKRVPGMRLIKPNWNGRLVRKLIPASAKLNKEGNSPSSTATQCNGHNQINE